MSRVFRTWIRPKSSAAVLLVGFLALFCCISSLQARQNKRDCRHQIKGKVLDATTKEPIPFVNILIKGTQTGTATDIKGNFLLDQLCEKEHTLIFSSLGYQDLTHHHDDYHDNPVIYMAPTVSQLESVIVEGEAIVGGLESVAVDKIDGTVLENKSTRTLAAVIEEIQGVTMVSAGSNVQLPVIHGLYGNRVLIINNGVKHGFQNWGTDHAPEIDIANASNISVLKGAAGVRFGPEALGGVVMIDGNNLDLSKSLKGNIGTGFQSNGRGFYTKASLGAGSEKFSYHFTGKFQKVGDRNTPDYVLTNTGMDEQSASAGFRYHLPNWDFKFYYSLVNQTLGLLRSSVVESGPLLIRSLQEDRPIIIRDFSYGINEPRQNTTHHLATMTVDWYSDFGKFTLLAGQQINQRKEFDVRRNADLPIIDLSLNTSDIRLEWLHPAVGGIEGTVGVQYFYQNNDNNPGTGTTPFIPNYNTNRVSLFLIESLNRGKTTYEAGLRLDHESNSVRGREVNQDLFSNVYDFTNLTASLGLVHQISDHWKLRSNIGSAWRTPNMAELYSFGQHGFKTQFGLWRYYTNEDNELRTDRVLTESDGVIEPENGYKWINELSYDKESHSLTITAYSHIINNYIFDRPVDVISTIRGPMPVFIYDQVDAVFAGADLTYRRRFSENLRGGIGFSYLWSRNVLDDEPLINQPPLNLNANVSWKTPLFMGLSSSKVTLEASYTFTQFQAPRTVKPEQLINGEVIVTPDSEIFDFQDAPGGYFLSNLRWEWKRNRFGGNIEVRNILNARYRDYLNQMRYFADEPGRNILLTLNYNF